MGPLARKAAPITASQLDLEYFRLRGFDFELTTMSGLGEALTKCRVNGIVGSLITIGSDGTTACNETIALGSNDTTMFSGSTRSDDTVRSNVTTEFNESTGANAK